MCMSKQHEIIEALIHLVHSQGVDGASTAKVATTAGVATGTLFHHFPTKKHLIEEAYVYVQSKKMSAVHKCVDDNAMNFQEKTRMFVEQVTSYWIAHRSEFEFTRQVFHSRWYSKEVEDRVIALHEEGREMLLQAMNNNHIRKIDINFLMPCLHSICLMIAERVLSTNKKQKKKHYLEEGHIMLWNILKP